MPNITPIQSDSSSAKYKVVSEKNTTENKNTSPEMSPLINRITSVRTSHQKSLINHKLTNNELYDEDTNSQQNEKNLYKLAQNSAQNSCSYPKLMKLKGITGITGVVGMAAGFLYLMGHQITPFFFQTEVIITFLQIWLHLWHHHYKYTCMINIFILQILT